MERRNTDEKIISMSTVQENGGATSKEKKNQTLGKIQTNLLLCSMYSTTVSIVISK